MLSNGKSYAIAFHDCDILTYTKEMLIRLCYPTVNPTCDFEFTKGYYARATDRFFGRTTRLFVFPFIQALIEIVGHHPFLTYLSGFRYPLSGEFSLIAELARINRIPSDWGLEVGVLAEVYRNCSSRRICQVDLCDIYEHKHQALNLDKPNEGLLRMAKDISRSIFQTLASMGIIMADSFFRTLRNTYLKEAQDIVAKFNDDALINGLYFDRHLETSSIIAFASGLDEAARDYTSRPISDYAFISNWARVGAAIPGFTDTLLEIVEEDNK